jgi:hypothetical protein
VRLPRGFHAKNDSRATRADVFAVIRQLRPRFDTTFLLKAKASKSVVDGGQVHLYRTACYLHVKHVADLVTRPGDRLFVIVGSLQTHNKRDAMRHALEDACSAVGGRTIVLCIWDAPSSWGLQVADYGLWPLTASSRAGNVPGCDLCGTDPPIGPGAVGDEMIGADYLGLPRRGPLDLLSPARCSIKAR